MTLPVLLRDYATFNLWANGRFVDWLRVLPAEALTANVPSSFPSLRLTLLHIWDAELIWLHRLNGESLSAFPSRTFAGTDEELFNGLLANSETFLHYLEAQDDGFFTRETTFRTMDGTVSTQTNAEILLHVFQHSTFHRGQLVTMGRLLGYTDPPKTDFIHYARNRNVVHG